ncbi:hypothetical protein [Bifidobacterium miconisargentati]|uniref:hypothetical protein n=1 Tax=Bifidobacterium miconisargentati TaxID=2834437 RepID=UPI001BDCE06A|nr:hypothetical protein [Bifidobacterium miconisargentati]MBW3089202.1 hypothetical protein [Bifidobacterium miconisargentati]
MKEQDITLILVLLSPVSAVLMNTPGGVVWTVTWSLLFAVTTSALTMHALVKL